LAFGVELGPQRLVRARGWWRRVRRLVAAVRHATCGHSYAGLGDADSVTTASLV